MRDDMENSDRSKLENQGNANLDTQIRAQLKLADELLQKYGKAKLVNVSEYGEEKNALETLAADLTDCFATLKTLVEGLAESRGQAVNLRPPLVAKGEHAGCKGMCPLCERHYESESYKSHNGLTRSVSEMRDFLELCRKVLLGDKVQPSELEKLKRRLADVESTCSELSETVEKFDVERIADELESALKAIVAARQETIDVTHSERTNMPWNSAIEARLVEFQTLAEQIRAAQATIMLCLQQQAQFKVWFGDGTKRWQDQRLATGEPLMVNAIDPALDYPCRCRPKPKPEAKPENKADKPNEPKPQAEQPTGRIMIGDK